MRAALAKLGVTEPTVRGERDDVRRRTVGDRIGDGIGTVDGVLIDRGEAKVRLLVDGGGGVQGLGERHILIPSDPVARIDPAHVFVDRTRPGA